jgi:hypothetical protein
MNRDLMESSETNRCTEQHQRTELIIVISLVSK